MRGKDTKTFWKTVKSMENKLTSPHLPTSMKLWSICKLLTLPHLIFQEAGLKTSPHFLLDDQSTKDSFLIRLQLKSRVMKHTQLTRKSSSTLSSRRLSTTIMARFSRANLSSTVPFNDSLLEQTSTHTHTSDTQ